MIKIKLKRIQGRDSTHRNQSFVSIISCFILLATYCLLTTLAGGCAVSMQKDRILAVVDGEPITEKDLEYSLTVAHRREDLSSASTLDLSKYLQKMVDDRLIINDARRSGMDEYPEVKQAVQAFILRESVVRLHDEEIVQKASITEKDIADFYKNYYEQFSLGLIEVQSEEEADKIFAQLNKGEDFGELARKYSVHPSNKDGGEVVLTKKSMSTYMGEAVLNLKPGEISGVKKMGRVYSIVKLIDRREAPDEELDSVRSKIEPVIRENKEKEREDEYLKYLRDRANINIDKDLLSTIKLDEAGQETGKWAKDERPLVKTDGVMLTVADFIAIASPYSRKSNEDIINSWIDRKLVDEEALSRHYENTTDFKEIVNRYENQILKNTFIKRVIIPQIVIKDETLEKYYSEHQKSFVEPEHFRIQQITVNDEKEAQEIFDNLQNGADFSWLAKRRSKDSLSSKGGDAGWFTKEKLHEKVREIIDTLKPGDISPIIVDDSSYIILELQEKTEETVKPFNEVRNNVYSALYGEQIDALYGKYTDQLKNEAQIKIYDDEVQMLQEKLQK